MNYLIAFWGSFLWNLILLRVSKDKFDKANQEFGWGLYAKHNIENWAVVFFFAPVLVWYLADIVTLLNQLIFMKLFSFELPMLEVYYLGAGPLSELIVHLILTWTGRKKSLLPTPEK